MVTALDEDQNVSTELSSKHVSEACLICVNLGDIAICRVVLENRNRLRVVPRQKVRTVVARIHFLLWQSLQCNNTLFRAEN